MRFLLGPYKVRLHFDMAILFVSFPLFQIVFLEDKREIFGIIRLFKNVGVDVQLLRTR